MATTKRKSRRKPVAPGTAAAKALQRTFDARPDTLDFRDRMFIPTLIEVPQELDIAAYENARWQGVDSGSGR
jgi:hypothetical protein